MDRFKNILFFADGSTGEKSALASAMVLADHNSAELTVMSVVPMVSTNDERLTSSIARLQAALISEREAIVRKLVSSTQPKKDPPSIKIRVIAGEKDFIQVIKMVVHDRIDLLVKSVNREGAISARLFGNSDLRLLRQCPCPVWIIKPGKRALKTVMAAVDLTTADRKVAQLSERILGLAKGIAEIEGANLHLVAAWDKPIESSIRKQLAADEYEALASRYKHNLRTRFDKLVTRNDLGSAGKHVVRGRPDRVIIRYAKDYDADLLVMGTLCRSGVPGLLIGNTAERVLNEVNCSVLTLKVKGFKTVIK